MTTLEEGDFRIKLPKGRVGRRFDDENHGLAHCMKAVDFIVELDDQILFIECKDPENPNAQAKQVEAFKKKLQSGVLDGELAMKLRDSFLYEWASGRATKPIYYVVLIGASYLSSAELLTRTDALRRALPLKGPLNAPWVQPFVEGCAVMNIKAWNETLPDFPVTRIGA